MSLERINSSFDSTKLMWVGFYYSHRIIPFQYILCEFDNMKGDQGFLLRYSSSLIPKITTAGPISSRSYIFWNCDHYLDIEVIKGSVDYRRLKARRDQCRQQLPLSSQSPQAAPSKSLVWMNFLLFEHCVILGIILPMLLFWAIIWSINQPTDANGHFFDRSKYSR